MQDTHIKINPKPIYSEVSSMLFSGAYAQEGVLNIATITAAKNNQWTVWNHRIITVTSNTVTMHISFIYQAPKFHIQCLGLSEWLFK